MSRTLDGEIVPLEALSPAMQSDLDGEEEGTYVIVHTDPPSGRSFSACVWKVRGVVWLTRQRGCSTVCATWQADLLSSDSSVRHSALCLTHVSSPVKLFLTRGATCLAE